MNTFEEGNTLLCSEKLRQPMYRWVVKSHRCGKIVHVALLASIFSRSASIHQSRSGASSSSFSSDFFPSLGNNRTERDREIRYRHRPFRYEQTYGGEGEHGLARNDRMPVESAAGHERASPLSTGYLE